MSLSIPPQSSSRAKNMRRIAPMSPTFERSLRTRSVNLSAILVTSVLCRSLEVTVIHPVG